MMQYTPRADVSVVLPAHNEADNLPALIEEIDATRGLWGRASEIIVVDDCSDDHTAAVVRGLLSKYAGLRLVRLVRRSGQSAALAAGFDQAQGEVVVTLDADRQNDPADIARLLQPLDEGRADVAIGWRRDRKDPFSKKIISKIANAVRNWVTRENVRDTGCALKVFRRECLQVIPRFDGMHRFFPTLVKIHGYRVVEIPVHHRPRTKGRTHYNIFNRLFRPMADLWAVYWLQHRAVRYQLREETALVEH